MDLAKPLDPGVVDYLSLSRFPGVKPYIRNKWNVPMYGVVAQVLALKVAHTTSVFEEATRRSFRPGAPPAWRAPRRETARRNISPPGAGAKRTTESPNACIPSPCAAPSV